MFHTLFDSENQNIDFNIQSQIYQKSGFNNGFKFDTNNSLYFGKGNTAIDQFNRKKNNINVIPRYTEHKYQRAKTKIKIVEYQNGFIVNNGEFRDKSIPENVKFLKEIQRGNIPNELLRKGIMDIEILLENKKNEIYYSTAYQNSNNNYVHPNIITNSTKIQYQDPDIYSLLINSNYRGNNELKIPNSKITNTFVPPSTKRIGNQRQVPLYSSNTVRVDNKHKAQKIQKRNNSHQKDKKENNFVDFLDFKKETDKKKKEKKEEKEEKKKFKPFSGFGQIIGNINMEGLYVNKEVKTSANFYSPICYINIRLFNGEVIKAPFNYGQTVGDIYIYVKRVSGSDNFVLLEGFPPKEITSYGRAIYELGLQNSVITQKIN